jgi:predicted amidohydrolase YtcJ
MLAGNAAVSLGSDWPFSGEESTFNPMQALQIGVTRKGVNSGSAKPFFPEQGVDILSLITAHSKNNAYAAFRDQDTGTLLKGKYADMIICDNNIFQIPPDQIASTGINHTLFRGQIIHRTG